MKSDKLLINRDIKANRVVLIGKDGERLGEFLRDDAIKLAQDDGLDLVMVDSSDKPICKVMDYGKHVYDQKKKDKQSSSPTVKTKEIKISYNTDDNYIDIKSNQAKKFLESGNRVKITVKFWGRQKAHTDIIRDKCMTFAKNLVDVADVMSEPKLAGNNIFMILAPKKQQ